MNTFKKVSIAMVSLAAVAGAVVGLAGCSTAASRATAALPQTAEVTAEAGRIIAADLTAQLNTANQSPRQARTMQVASVEISEVIEVVLVEASRLPAGDRLVDASLVDADRGVAQNVRL